MPELGCTAQGNTAFGRKSGFPFSVELEKPGESPLLLLRFAANGPVKPLLKQLRVQPAGHARWFGEADGETGGILVAQISPPSDFYVKSDLYSALNKAVAALQAAGLSAGDTCPLCNLSGCDCAAFLNDAYRPAHKQCVDTRLALPEKDTQLPATVRGHVATGILGAVLGAFLGVLPSWAQLLNEGEVHLAMYAFIPIFSALLYRLFRGRASTAVAGLSVLLSSLLAAFALEQVWYWLTRTILDNTAYTFSQTILHYFRTYNLWLTLKDMWLSLLFLVVGFFPAAVLLRRYVATGRQKPRPIRGSRFVLASVQLLADPEPPPLPGAGDDPSSNLTGHDAAPPDDESPNPPSIPSADHGKEVP